MKTGLSIDPNTRQTGLVWWHGHECLQGETVTANGWRAMAQLMRAVIMKHAPDWVAVEGVYVGKNAQTALKLAYLVGAIVAFCDAHGIPVYALSTKEIDATLGIQYASDERKAATERFAFYSGQEGLDEHQCDAYAVGRAALGKIKVEAWEQGKAFDSDG
jgi:Holliday junction resolvasome RuvABC endonuclease subunit